MEIPIKDKVFKRKNLKIWTANNLSTHINFYRPQNLSPSNNEENNFKKELSNNYQLLDNLKFDIMNVLNSITDHSDIIPFYKNPRSEKKYEKLVDRIKKIEISKEVNISDFFTFLKSSSFNNGQLINEYGCKDTNELVSRLYQEAKLSDYLLRKIKDLCFLLNLKHTNDYLKFENDYQETNSKFNSLNELLECLLNKLNRDTKKTHNHLQINKCEVFEIINQKEHNSSFFFDASNRLEFDDFVEEEHGDAEFNKSTFGTKNDNHRLSETLQIKLPEETRSSIKFDTFKNEIRELEVNQHEDNLKEKKSIIKEKDDIIEHLRYVIDEYNKMVINNKSDQEKIKLQLFDKVKDLTRKNQRLEERIQSLKDEYDTVRKNKSILESQLKKGNLDYEIVLKDEFESMKVSFIRRIEELGSNLADLRGEMNRKNSILEENLKNANMQKDYFMKQVVKNRK